MLVSSYAQRAPLHATRQRFVIVNTLSGTVGVSGAPPSHDASEQNSAGGDVSVRGGATAGASAAGAWRRKAWARGGIENLRVFDTEEELRVE